VEFVRPRRRIFGFAGETLPRDNELVQAVIGRLASTAHAARAIVSASAAELDHVLARHLAGLATDADFVQAELNVFKAQQTILPLVLDATTELFEVGGASATSTSISLDRHWRNARTIASHNPAIHRRRALGDYYLNGVAPSWGKPSPRADDRADA
jgi:alkylation response protein AidB-like acyl-CoA dehydrogenase